ncbi:MAG: sugar-binding protein, partial [Planctomycetota bacterium]
PLKVICASFTKQAPVIDGKLDEAAWQDAEIRTDFTSPSTGDNLSRKTSLRMLYDKNNIYFGIECEWEDAELLKKGIAKILKKYGPPPADKCDFSNYYNRYGLELFIDPGASRNNYYQILVNAAEQYTGNYKTRWDQFKGGHKRKGNVTGNTWTFEMAYPAPKPLSAGEKWGINVCRNDETYYGIWKQVGGAYHNPSKFGTMIIGSYREWWQVKWQKGLKAELDKIVRGRKKAVKIKYFLPLLEDLQKKAAELSDLVKQNPPENRKNFELLYHKFFDFKTEFNRVEKLYKASSLIN